MMDVLSPIQRSYCMSRIRGKDTKPEMVIRRLVHALGYRFRLHARGLPGSPDLVLPRHKKIVFVHGCFWHRHRCRYGQAMPTTRSAFWRSKLEATKVRDIRNRKELGRLGWEVLVIWECQTRKPERLLRRVVQFLLSGDPVPNSGVGRR